LIVILSEAKDLRLYPQKTLNSFGRSLEGVMSNPLNLKSRPLFVSLIGVTDIGKRILLPN